MDDPNLLLSRNLASFLKDKGINAKAFATKAQENGIPLDYSYLTRLLNMHLKGAGAVNVSLGKLSEISKAVNLFDNHFQITESALLNPEFPPKQSEALSHPESLKKDYIQSIQRFVIETGQLGWLEVTKDIVTLELLADIALAKFLETESGSLLTNNIESSDYEKTSVK